MEFPSKSGLGSGYAGGTAHPRGAWKKRKSFVATHLCGWVSQGSAVGGQKGTWLTPPSLCALRDANASENEFCPFDFHPVSYFQKGVTVFSGISIVKFVVIFFFFLLTLGKFSADDLSTKYFTDPC